LRAFIYEIFVAVIVCSKLNKFHSIASNLAYHLYVYVKTQLRYKSKYEVPRSDSIREYRAKISRWTLSLGELIYGASPA